MLEIILWYVVPNVVMFGGLYLLGKGIERATWFFIENYDDIKSGKLTMTKRRN